MSGESTSPPSYRGRPISDEEIQRLADEAEVGYSLVRPTPAPREGHTFVGLPVG